ncbi:hypothetical protein Ocin01_05825 [Orchesella cincta]|uniref:Uncharacterized protein n=1 Tax=Orchesella cincta TaxID=48709 RepID=A0A1D2N6K4_ORCCI|nr:hypothetical protein Ocin01_05825 [Orchesella cincta]
MTPLNCLGARKFTQFAVVLLLLGISCEGVQDVTGNSLLSPLRWNYRSWLINGAKASGRIREIESADKRPTEDPVELTTGTIVHQVLLDLENPEDERGFTSTTAVKYFLPEQNYSNYRLAVHLKTCDYDDDEHIIIDMGSGHNLTWRCAKHESYGTKHVGDPYVSVQHFVDGIEGDVLITTNFPSSNYNRNKAVIVINLYQDYDSPDSCPRGFFDCSAPICPDCCSDGAINGDSSKRKHKKSRCIPNVLKCDGSPNCGMSKNPDETNEVCHRETYCQCHTLCLTWNYVLTSLAIAVLFIITPTAIVFALFHRRNVALERARLLRMAQQRMVTRDSPANDLPPTYDEVYDTKEPPPCFCQAVGAETLDTQRSDVENGNDSNVIGSQNLGFQCSCSNVSSDIAAEPPPDYLDVNGISNNGSSHCSVENLNREVEV